MKLRMSSIPLMLEYVSNLKDAPGDREAVRRILDHEDYRYERGRYGIGSTDHLVDYFSRLTAIAPEEIPDLSGDHRKNSLRDKHGLWLDCAAHPEKYGDRLERVKAVFTDRFLADMQRRLEAMFPAGTEMIASPYVVSTLSFGQSFGYPYGGGLHIDLFGVERYCSIGELPRLVLHEMHHLQVQKMEQAAGLLDRFGPLERYLFGFAGEGLAVKFCNNAEGVVSKRLEPGEAPNQGVPAIAELNRHFPEHFRLFCGTVRRIAAGELTQEDVDRQFGEYWFNAYLYGDRMLEQTPVYSFGSELYGCVYDAFGLDAVYECFYHPARLISYFNRAHCGWSIPE